MDIYLVRDDAVGHLVDARQIPNLSDWIISDETVRMERAG
jgi:hypothetical protein